jgi:hypothetical protein
MLSSYVTLLSLSSLYLTHTSASQPAFVPAQQRRAKFAYFSHTHTYRKQRSVMLSVQVPAAEKHWTGKE